MFIFTSFGFRAPIIKEKLKAVLSDVATKTILIIPFAGFNSNKCADNEKSGLVEFGFTPENILVCRDKSSFNRVFDYIYVPGGDTFKLLNSVQNLDLMKCIKQFVDNGSVYIGVSAGAELATPNLEYVRYFEDNNYSIVDFKGLSLVNEVIIPHADQHQISEQFLNVIGDTQRNNYLSIANDGLVVYDLNEGIASIEFI